MEHDWEIVELIDKVEISDGVFRLAKILDKNSGLNVYTVYENDKSLGIFTKLGHAQKIMQDRISIWKNTERDWDLVELIDKKEVTGMEFCLAKILDKNSGLNVYAVYENDRSAGICTKLGNAQKLLQERIRAWQEMEHDWEVSDDIEKEEIFGREFRICQVVDRFTGTIAFAAFDNDETVGIFIELVNVQKALHERIATRLHAWKNKEHDWEIVEVLNVERTFCLNQLIEKNSGFTVYSITDSQSGRAETIGIFTELKDAYQELHECIELREIALDSSHTFGYDDD